MKKRLNIKMVLVLQVLFLGIGFSCAKIVNAGIFTNVFDLFVDLPNILCMLCFIVPSVWVMGIGQDLLKSLSVGRKDYSLLELKRIQEALQGLHKLNIFAAMLVVLISLLWYLQAIRVELLEHLGKGLVVCFLPVFYAVVVEYMLLPIMMNVQREINEVMMIDEAD